MHHPLAPPQKNHFEEELTGNKPKQKMATLSADNNAVPNPMMEGGMNQPIALSPMIFATPDWRMATDSEVEEYVKVHVTKVLQLEDCTEEDTANAEADLKKKVRTIAELSTMKIRGRYVMDAKKVGLEIDFEGTPIRCYDDIIALQKSPYCTLAKSKQIFDSVYKPTNTKRKKRHWYCRYPLKLYESSTSGLWKKEHAKAFVGWWRV